MRFILVSRSSAVDRRIVGSIIDLVATTGFGRQLSEPKAIISGELAQMPKTPFVGNVGDLDRLQINPAEFPADSIQAPSLHESRRRQPEARRKSIVQCSRARAGDVAKRSN